MNQEIQVVRWDITSSKQRNGKMQNNNLTSNVLDYSGWLVETERQKKSDGEHEKFTKRNLQTEENTYRDRHLLKNDVRSNKLDETI